MLAILHSTSKDHQEFRKFYRIDRKRVEVNHTSGSFSETNRPVVRISLLSPQKSRHDDDKIFHISNSLGTKMEW